MLENAGSVRTDFSNDPEYDYIVIMQSRTFLGWDSSIKDDRRTMLIQMFGDRCEYLKIGDEILDQESKCWIMKVKCINPW